MICPKCYGTGRITLPHRVDDKVESKCDYDGCVNGIVHCCDGVQAQPDEATFVLLFTEETKSG